ncbi:hypothetical protein Tco_0654122 [Tanacetum coccineum]|uniref:Uncharacterized protein n=1 Tax=Tanacetum coccineum TaxID=301880 RepID=A0ABQ4X2B5_9ASTR
MVGLTSCFLLKLSLGVRRRIQTGEENMILCAAVLLLLSEGNVQAMIDVDYELGVRLQAQEQEELTIEERYGYRVGKRELQEGKDDKKAVLREQEKNLSLIIQRSRTIDAIPLATKPPIIVDWKIIKEGKMIYFQIIRADGSSRRYSLMIKMLQNIDKEDLETLWKLVPRNTWKYKD